MSILKELNAIPSTPKDLRKFGWTMGIIFGLIGAWLYWKGRPAWPYLAGLSAFFLFFGTCLPILLKPIQTVWMGLALVMGAVMSRVILALLFIVVVAPIGLITRICGIDFMGRKRTADMNGFWTVRDSASREDMTRYERQA